MEELAVLMFLCSWWWFKVYSFLWSDYLLLQRICVDTQIVAGAVLTWRLGYLQQHPVQVLNSLVSMFSAETDRMEDIRIDKGRYQTLRLFDGCRQLVVQPRQALCH